MEYLIRLLPDNYESPKVDSTVNPFGGWCTNGGTPIGDACRSGYSPPKGFCEVGTSQTSWCDPGCIPM